MRSIDRFRAHPLLPVTRTLALLLLLLPSIGSPAVAGVNVNGAMLVHTDDSIVYTADVNYCQQQLPATCQSLHTRTDKHAPDAAVIFAVAAFLPTANPCVSTVQFGIHHNLPPNQGYIYAYSMCGTLELPDAGWPEQGNPGVGDLVATNPTTALIWPFYWFACDENGPGTFFCTRTYPSTNEAKFVDCSDPPEEDLCRNFGCVHWFDDGGFNNCPVPPPGTGACCFADGTCQVLTQAQCGQQGGTYQGDNTTCSPNPCPQPPTGACCFADGHCTVLRPAQCAQQGGTYWGDNTTCSPNPCPQPPTGACCFPDGHCTILTQVQCGQQDGIYQGNDRSCVPSPCTPCGQGPRQKMTAPGRPAAFLRGDGPSHLYRTGRNTCYSEPPDLNGGMGTSEIVSSLGLDAEVANDFLVSTDNTVVSVTAWGGYYDNQNGCSDNEVTGFIAKFYDDAGCAPRNLLNVFHGNPTITCITCRDWVHPIYQYDLPVSQAVSANAVYWLGFQAGDHIAPPDWGRLAAPSTLGCDSMFKGAYFGYPNWIDCLYAFGVPFDASQELQCDVNTPLGACCFADGHCSILSESQCQQQGGIYQGTGTSCTPNPCPQPPPGACCFPDGHCTILGQAQCVQEGGVYQGDNTSCTPNPCPQPPTGACCFADLHCTVLTEAQCQQQGGEYQGNWVSCNPNPCTVAGACCFPDGSCQILPRITCERQGGTYQGNDTSCEPNPCPPPATGACCFPDTHCSVLTGLQCQQQGGRYLGDGTSCNPNPCYPCGGGPHPRTGSPSRLKPYVRGSGGHNALPPSRDVIFSEPPDLNGLIASSEIISALGLESEIANDFSSGANTTVFCARAWGGYFNNQNGCADNEISCFRAKFYDDGGCVPNNLLGVFGGTAYISSVGCQGGVYPMYEYDLHVSQAISAGTLYWLGFQAGDHAFPPQWGRLAAPSTIGCDSMFLSAIFGFPNWTDCASVFGVAYDASQELADWSCGGAVPTQKTTWGRVKALYRETGK